MSTQSYGIPFTLVNLSMNMLTDFTLFINSYNI